MGTQNSRSSFKNNSSMLASNNNYQPSQYTTVYSDSFLLATPKISPSAKMSMCSPNSRGTMVVTQSC